MSFLSLLRICLFALLPGMAFAQPTITYADGTALQLQYCYQDSAYQLRGQPADGVFTGCGVYQQNGQWYFNPVTATVGITVFPYACMLTYTAGNQSISKNLLIYKPVKTEPALSDTVTCNGQFVLDAHTLYAGAYRYSWAPATGLQHPDSNYTAGYITQTTALVLTAEDRTSGCTGSDTVIITLSPAPDVRITPNQVSIRSRETVQLSASGALRYSWRPTAWLDNDTAANPIAAPRQSVTYIVTGVNAAGCSDTASVSITINDRFFVPNAFSPNGDGLNDVFRIENFGYQELESFRVYNRWGTVVFETTDGVKGWDGRINGAPADCGTYYYLIRLKQTGQERTNLKGEMQLIR